MSFSREVKWEILDNKQLHRNYGDALAYGLFFAGQSYNEDKICLVTKYDRVISEFEEFAEKIIGKELKISKKALGRETQIDIADRQSRRKLLEYFSEISKELAKDNGILSAFMAGVFLACGYAINPEKSYHIEFVAPEKQVGELIFHLILQLLPNFKTTTRRDKIVVYSKESEKIRDLLTLMGASRASLKIIDVEMIKNVRNNANRITNCETANIGKTVNAATAQIEDIKLIFNRLGEDGLASNLAETAKVRVDNPYASLRELAELLDPPISRSGIHHRLKQIGKLADSLRAD